MVTTDSGNLNVYYNDGFLAPLKPQLTNNIMFNLILLANMSGGNLRDYFYYASKIPYTKSSVVYNEKSASPFLAFTIWTWVSHLVRFYAG